MKTYDFPCGCSFPIQGEVNSRPALDLNLDINSVPLDCDRTWNLISEGNTVGCFQIESQLGQILSKRLKPRNIEHLAALTAIMRPGCVSGSCQVHTNYYINEKGNYRFTKETLSNLYKKKDKVKFLVSFDESSGKFIKNKVRDILHTGIKKTYKIKLRKTIQKSPGDWENYYNLKCTEDHKLLTPSGWKELKDFKRGDRFAIPKYKGTRTAVKYISGQKGFRDICFKNYEYKCIFCDWEEASLDVNHIDGNRTTNNNPENLCFMCPNHHRMYSEGLISKEEVLEARKKYELPKYEDVEWAEYQNHEFVEETDVYDIMMEGPHHNFIAGNVIVHNCLESEMEDGKSITDHYILRKNLQEEVQYLHPALENSLSSTYGLMTYQENAIAIVRDVAGFDLRQADILRKAIGKKKPELMAKMKEQFLEGCKSEGIVNQDTAEQIFEWIEKSQRYSFNKSHSVAYALTAYLTAYCKAHFPRAFFASYLYYSYEKQKPHEEIAKLVNNARQMNIEVVPPDLRKRNIHFEIFDRDIYFGLSDIKGIGQSVCKRMIDSINKVEKEIGAIEKWTWMQFLVYYSQNVTSTAIKNMIGAGALRQFDIPRTQMLYEYELYSSLTEKEQKNIKALYPEYNWKRITDIFVKMLELPTGKDGIISTKRRASKVQALHKASINRPYKMKDMPGWLAGIEEKLLGVSLTCTTVEECDTSQANCTVKEVSDGFSGMNGVILVACKIDEIREVKTKRGKNPGQSMAFAKVSDITGSLESVVIFPQQFEDFQETLFESNNIMISGERDKKNDSLIVKKIYQL